MTKSVARRVVQTASPLIILAAATCVYVLLHATKQAAMTTEPTEPVLAVRTIGVSFNDHQPELKVYGNTVAGRQVEVRALVAGRVVRTGPQLVVGGRVNAGEMLLSIDPFHYQSDVKETSTDLAEAKAKLAEIDASIKLEMDNLALARAQLNLADTDLGRATKLAGRGTLSPRQRDDRRLTRLQRQQTATQSENNVKIWSTRREQQLAKIERIETRLKRARRSLRDSVLTAPFQAYVKDVGAEVGRMLSVSDRVATLIDRNWIDVRFSLTDSQFGRLVGSQEGLIGRAVTVRWDVGRRTLSYSAKVERIDPAVEADSGGFQVYARIHDPNQPVSILPGTFVEVMLQDTVFQRVFKVPSQAIYDGQSVYTIVGGRLQKRSIKVVGASGKDLLINGSLDPGDRIVVTRLVHPGDGVRVRDHTLDES